MHSFRKRNNHNQDACVTFGRWPCSGKSTDVGLGTAGNGQRVWQTSERLLERKHCTCQVRNPSYSELNHTENGFRVIDWFLRDGLVRKGMWLHEPGQWVKVKLNLCKGKVNQTKYGRRDWWCLPKAWQTAFLRPRKLTEVTQNPHFWTLTWHDWRCSSVFQ